MANLMQKQKRKLSLFLILFVIGLFAIVPKQTALAGTITYQAENATIYQGVTETLNTGYTGASYVNYNNVTGSYVEWTVNASAAGDASLVFTFANGTTVNRPMEIKVNGTVVSSSMAFAPTGAFTTWNTAQLTVHLNAGSNTIRATATTANGGPNVDKLDVTEIQTIPGTTYQAEDATIYQGITETLNSGYTGSSYVNYNNVTGSYVEWTVTTAAAGNVNLIFTFANGTAVDRPMEIKVNGTVVSSSMSFAPTGAFTTWNTAQLTAFLNAGSNVIRATAITANGGPNVDKLDIGSVAALPARQMENIDRGTVAVKLSSGVFVGWRQLGTEAADVTYNLYRGTTKLNATPLTVTNYTDTAGTQSSSYSVAAVVNGTEQAKSAAVSVLANNYVPVPITAPAGGTTPDGVAYTYAAGDASVGDLDGDHQYEIVLKWCPSNETTNMAGYTGPAYFDAYEMNGTRLWRINMGKNVRAGEHQTQFTVYDLDGDGKAEVAMKTADGTVDGTGTVIGSSTADYRDSSGVVLTGPEYLTVFKGSNGQALSTVTFSPARGTVTDWGDGYGNRVDRFNAAVAYLDGVRPSLIECRGYYTGAVSGYTKGQSKIAAYNFRNGALTKVWEFDAIRDDQTPSRNQNVTFVGQGYHSVEVGDVDSDGKDEIIYGACAINDNGTGMYSTGLGHGDAQHLGDLDPDRPGLEVFQVHESASAQGLEEHDARTGAIIWALNTTPYGDIGRCMSAHVDPRYKGDQMWTNTPPSTTAQAIAMYDCKGNQISSTNPVSADFAIWWDGDLLRELLDHNWSTWSVPGTPRIDKWNYLNNTRQNLVTFNDCYSVNASKGVPCLQADLMGDWREEIILRNTTSTELRIYTTTAPTDTKIYTLMHDPLYRLGVAWQNSAYNQPPHTGFYIGTNMSTPPVPNIYMAP